VGGGDCADAVRLRHVRAHETRAAWSDLMKTRLCLLAVVALVIWGMKAYYASARADDLRWILSPTAWLAGVMTGTAFVMTPGEGYLSSEHLFLIEKSCAGINFMIAAFGMVTVTLLHRVGSRLDGARVLAVGLVAGYAAAVIINAVRIAIAMWLAAHHAALSTLTPADVHRLEGITVYFGGLMLLHELVQRFDCGWTAAPCEQSRVR
jgi:exosortase K